MKLSPQWLRDFVEIKTDDTRLADDLTLAGIAVEKVDGSIFEMDITTNRPDAMNHYGVARECSAIYDLPLRAIEPQLPEASAAKAASSWISNCSAEALLHPKAFVTARADSSLRSE